MKKRYESCFRPLHLFLVTEKKKKICVEGVKKNRPQTEKTAAFKAAGSDQFHIGPCTAHYKIHQDALKTAYELGHRGTNMLHTHYNQNMRKEEAVRFWGILPNLVELKATEPVVSP